MTIMIMHWKDDVYFNKKETNNFQVKFMENIDNKTENRDKHS